MKIVAFGTSLTSRGVWPQTLEKELTACLKVPVTVQTVARAGSTTQWALDQTDQVIARQPDTIFIEFYGNDSALHRFIGVSTSRANFSSILDQLQQGAPEARIIMIAFNHVFGLRGLMRPFFNAYIDAHLSEIGKRGMDSVDFRPLWHGLPKIERRRKIPDGLHPQPEESARLIVPKLTEFVIRGVSIG